MNAGVLVIVLLFTAAGGMMGWHAQRVKSAHGDVRVGKNRVSGGRQTRLKSGLVVLGLAVAAILVMAAALHL
jgi:hypothetical protein